MKGILLVLSSVFTVTLSGCCYTALLTQGVRSALPRPVSATTPTLQSTASLSPQPVANASPTPQPDKPVSPDPAAPASAVSDGFEELMEYVPSEWADEHGYEAISQGLLLLDIARMSARLGLPPMTGMDDRKVKLGLIAGMNHQDLLRCPGVWTGAGAFDEWGWDIADVDQILCHLQTGTAVLLGDFGRPEVRERLIGKGYRTHRAGQFTIYIGDAGTTSFAVKSDTLILSEEESEVKRLIKQKDDPGRGLHHNPAVAELLSLLNEDLWGIWIAPSGDSRMFEAYIQGVLDVFSHNERLVEGLTTFYEPGQAVEFGWDTMAVGFVGSKDDVTTLTFLYHYPSADEARNDAPLLERTLTEMPSLNSVRGTVLGDLLELQTIEATGSVLKAVVTTRNQGFLGGRLTNADYFFLPFRVVAPMPFPDWHEVNSVEGGFSILMPGAPSEHSRQINSPSGEIDTHTVVFDGQGYHYALSYFDYPLKPFQALNLDAALENWRKVLAVNYRHTVLEESVVSAGRRQGRELKAESNDETSFRWRFFVVRNRLYLLEVSAPEKEAFSQDADTFFDSFEILE